MDDLQSEKEQIEEIRAWWAEYGKFVIAGVVIAVAGMVGINQYKSNRLDAQVEASVLFETLAEHVAAGDLEDAETVAAELSTDYANTAYSGQARLAMARLYMDRNRDQDAADALAELIDLGSNSELRGVARARLARILLYQEKPQEVVDLLQGQDDPAFNAVYAESLGDAFAALGDVEQAVAAYEIALADDTQSVNRAIVQMKLVDLPDADAGDTDADTDVAADAGAAADAEGAAKDEAGAAE